MATRGTAVRTHGLTHIAVAVRDPKRSVGFYRAGSGLCFAVWLVVGVFAVPRWYMSARSPVLVQTEQAVWLAIPVAAETVTEVAIAVQGIEI